MSTNALSPSATAGLEHDGPTGYAAAVRASLRDIPPETVDELTDGLEADLAEQAEEHGVSDLTGILGPAAAYADELRTSAGIPSQPVAGSGGSRLHTRLERSYDGWAETWHTRLAGWDANLARQSWWPDVRSAFVGLRPWWWIARGLIAAQVVVSALLGQWAFRVWPLPGLPVTHAVVLAVVSLVCVVGSIALGRGWLRSRRRVRALSLLANIIAAWVGLIFVMSVLDTFSNYVRYGGGSAPVQSAPYQQPGLSQDGRPINNIFAYDLNGKLLQGVRLYDQSGNRIEASHDVTDRVPFPYRDSNGNAIWNTYPRYVSSQSVTGYGGNDEKGRPQYADESGNLVTITPQAPIPPMVAVIGVKPPASNDNPEAAQLSAGATSAATLKAGTPVVKGTPQVGGTLAVTPGTWEPRPSLSYQWKRNGASISGATKATYVLTAADRGKTITVTVTGELAGYPDATATSAPTPAIR